MVLDGAKKKFLNFTKVIRGLERRWVRDLEKKNTQTGYSDA